MVPGAQDFRAHADARTVRPLVAKSPGRRLRGALPAAAAVLLAAAALACALPGRVLAGEPGQTSFADALTTTGPTPPPNVRVSSRSLGGAPAAAGEVLLGAVPAYEWHDGCGPTSAGMVLGYWDASGFPDLIAGDASTQTAAADQAIATHGSSSAPGHWEDYAQPKEYGDSGVLDDRSEAPQGDEHASDSIADFMQTSWSAKGLSYGWSFTNMVGPALADYVALVDPGTTVTTKDYYYDGSTARRLTFAVLQAEIDAGRPLVLYVDSSGDGVSDHAVTGIGYRETGGYPEYACWDTWSTNVRWSRFREVSSDYAWGVYGGTTVALTPSDPSADVSRPVTTVSGADDAWSATPVTLTFTATDTGSGVDFIEAGVDVDSAALESIGGSPATLEVGGQGVHLVSYRATDKNGNQETTRTCTVRVDGEGPVTTMRAATVRRGARATLRYRVDDLTPEARVRLVVRTLSGRLRATLRPGWRATGTTLGVTWRATIPRGRYRVCVYATDQAGNGQAVAARARLTVR